MRPQTHTKAKPLLPVAGKPVLDHVMDALAGLEVSEFIFITGHLKEQIEEHIKRYGVKARFLEQQVKDGTAGAIKLAEPYVDEPVLIIFVDTIFDADLSLIATSVDDGIIWAQEVEDYQRFGVIVTDKDGYMERIVEKPSEPVSKLANIGVYYIKTYQLMFEGIHHVYANDVKVKGEYFLTDAFQYMIDHGAKLKVAPVEGWYDCGKPETTLESNAILLGKHHARESDVTGSTIHEPVYIGKGCEIIASEIGPNVTIMPGCTIKHARLENCIIDEGSTVVGIALRDSILGTNTFLEGNGDHGRRHRVRLGCHSYARLE